MTKHHIRRNVASVGRNVIIALLVIHLLPVWIFTYFPTQDGASHIYNSYVLKEYHKHENYRLREVYELRLTLFPNWTSHAFLALLMYVFPPIICEKILISICIGLLPLSLFYFLNSVQEGNATFRTGWIHLRVQLPTPHGILQLCPEYVPFLFHLGILVEAQG